jgi:hypothetical protein
MGEEVVGYKGKPDKEIGSASGQFVAGFPEMAPEALRLPPDLARVVAAWPELPEHVRATSLMLLESAKK